MFCLNDSNRFFLYPFPTDMRKSFYSLSGIVTNGMGMDIQDGDAFIFVNRPCTSMKVLHMECGGLVIYHLKLEKGSLALPSKVFETDVPMETGWSDLVMMVEGITPNTMRKPNRWKPAKKIPDTVVKT